MILEILEFPVKNLLVRVWNFREKITNFFIYLIWWRYDIQYNDT